MTINEFNACIDCLHWLVKAHNLKAKYIRLGPDATATLEMITKLTVMVEAPWCNPTGCSMYHNFLIHPRPMECNGIALLLNPS